MNVGDLVLAQSRCKENIIEPKPKPVPWLVLGTMSAYDYRHLYGFVKKTGDPYKNADIIVIMDMASDEISWAHDDPEWDGWSYELLLPFSECEDVRIHDG